MSKTKEKRTHRGAFGGKSIFTDSQHINSIEFIKNKFEELSKKNNNLYLTDISNGYFIFEHHILYFRDKKNPEWLFALWANYDKDLNIESVTYIGEADELVDKFKPSRTYVSTKNEDEFLSELKIIEDNPKLAFVASYEDIPIDFPAYENRPYTYSDGTVEDNYVGYQATVSKEKNEKGFYSTIQDKSINKEEFIEKVYTEYFDRKNNREKFYNKWNDYIKNNMLNNILDSHPYINGVGLIDKNVDGWKCSPRYSVVISVYANKYYKDHSVKKCKHYNKKLTKLDEELFKSVDKILSNTDDILDNAEKENGSYLQLADLKYLDFRSLVTSYDELYKGCSIVKLKI